MLSALVDVILPVVLVAMAGVVLARRFQLDQGTLTKVQLYGLTPALAFSSLMKMNVNGHDVLRMGAAYALVTLTAGLVAVLVARRMPPGSRRGLVACTLIGNNGNFGLPIALLALGQAGLDQAVLLFLFSLVVMWTVGPALLGGHTRPAQMLTSIARLPVTWALVLAIVIRLIGITPPRGVLTAVDLLAGAAVPMVLLSLGIQLGYADRIHVTRPVLTAVGLRVFVVPVLAYGGGRLVGLTGLPLQSLVLACAMPTAVNTFMLAKEFGSDPETVASAVALSTLVSIGTLAVVVANLPLLA